MGYTDWSDKHYADKQRLRASTNTPTFAYHAAVASGAAATAAHPSMDPKGAKQRESRDSDAHPNALAVAVMFDVTGSMGGVPVTLQKELCKLMSLLISRNYAKDPQILCGAIGDATCDKVPLQVGQFESGVEIENDLTNIYIEGRGGGQIHESYELAMYFLARHTTIDCWEKRKHKGYAFIIGDEMPYPEVKTREVKDVIGDELREPIPTADILAELSQRYEVFHILPNLTQNYTNNEVREAWRKLLGERSLLLDKSADDEEGGVCDLIASTIGNTEGISLDQICTDLTNSGSKPETVKAVRGALTPYSSKLNNALAATVPDSGAPSGLSAL